MLSAFRLNFDKIYHSKYFNVLAFICRYMIAIVLLISAFFKLTDLQGFQTSLYKLAMVYDRFIPLISYLIPITELLLAILLIINLSSLAVSKFLIYLFVFFTTILTVKLFEGTEASCGCFGQLMDNKIDCPTHSK
jgi:uncharacterized membrane protein YphA (DoxX/SURF4 family)